MSTNCLPFLPADAQKLRFWVPSALRAPAPLTSNVEAVEKPIFPQKNSAGFARAIFDFHAVFTVDRNRPGGWPPRLRQARRLLENSPLSLEQIVARVGYNDVSTFRRLFRREIGCSPADYGRRFTSPQTAGKLSPAGRNAG